MATEPDYLGLLPGQRYAAPKDDDLEVQVEIDGRLHPAKVLGRNGPRVQVSVEIDGDRYTRWVDAATVTSP